MSDILRKRVMHATNRDDDNGRFSQPSTPISRDQIDDLLAQCRSDLGASPQSRTSVASTATFHTARNIEISTESGGRKLMSEDEVSSLVHNALRRARQATSSSSISPRHRMRRAGGGSNPLSPHSMAGSTGSRPPPSPTKSSVFFPENQGSNANETSSPSAYMRGRSGRVALPAKYSKLDSSLESKGSFVAPSIVGSQEFASTIEATVSNISGFSDAPQYSSNTYGLSRAPTEDESLPHDASMNSSEAIIRRVEEEIANARRAAQEANRRLAGVSSSLRSPASSNARSHLTTRAKEPTPPSPTYGRTQHPRSEAIPPSMSTESDNLDNKYSSAMEVLAAEFDDDGPSFDRSASEPEVISPPSIRRKQPALSVETSFSDPTEEDKQDEHEDIESRCEIMEDKKVEDFPQDDPQDDKCFAKYRHIISPREESSSPWKQFEPSQVNDKNFEPTRIADKNREVPEFPILESEAMDKTRYTAPHVKAKSADDMMAVPQEAKEVKAVDVTEALHMASKPKGTSAGLPSHYSAQGNVFMRMLNNEDHTPKDSLEISTGKLEKTPSKEIIDLTAMGSLVSSPNEVANDQSLSLPESTDRNESTNLVVDLDHEMDSNANELKIPYSEVDGSTSNVERAGSFESTEGDFQVDRQSALESTSPLTEHISLSHSEGPGQIVPKIFANVSSDNEVLEGHESTKEDKEDGEDISLPIFLNDDPTMSLDESTGNALVENESLPISMNNVPALSVDESAHDIVENVSLPQSSINDPTMSLDESTGNDLVENESLPISLNNDLTMSLDESTHDIVENVSLPHPSKNDPTVSFDESTHGMVEEVSQPNTLKNDTTPSLDESTLYTEVVPSNGTVDGFDAHDLAQFVVGKDESIGITADSKNVDNTEHLLDNVAADSCSERGSNMDDDLGSMTKERESECIPKKYDDLQPQSTKASEANENSVDIPTQPFAVQLDDGGEEFGFEITAAWSTSKRDGLGYTCTGNETNLVPETEPEVEMSLTASSGVGGSASHGQTDEPIVTYPSVEDLSGTAQLFQQIGTSEHDENNRKDADEAKLSSNSEDNECVKRQETISSDASSLYDGPSYTASSENDTEASVVSTAKKGRVESVLESHSRESEPNIEVAKECAIPIDLDDTHSPSADTAVAGNGEKDCNLEENQGTPLVSGSGSSDATQVAGNNEFQLPEQSNAVGDEHRVVEIQSPSKSTNSFWWTEGSGEQEDNDEAKDKVVPEGPDGESEGKQETKTTSLLVRAPSPQQLELSAKCVVSETKQQHMPPDATPSPVQENNPSESNQAAPKTDPVPVSASLRSSKVRFKQRYPVPPLPNRPRASEDIIKDNRVARDGCALFLKKPKPDLQELLDAARGSSIPRRSNACGALKVLTLQKKNKLTLVRTAGFLDALVFATSAKLSRRDMEASLNARARAVCAISSVAEPKDNRELVMEHPGLMAALVKTAIEDNGEARTAACGAFAMLAKTPANREPLAHTNNLLNVLAMILTGKLVPDQLEETKPTYSADDEDSVHSASSCSGSESSGSGAESDFSHSKDEDEVTLPTVMSMREQKREQNGEIAQRGQMNACATLLHISKQCGATPLMCYNESLMEGLIDVLQIEDDPMHTKYLEILCNLSRFPENNTYLAQFPGMIDTLVENGKSPSAADRLWALRTLQNISSDVAGKSIIATRVVLEMLSMGVMRDSIEEKIAATSTLYNLSTEPGAVVPLTNTKNVVATLVHVAHNPDSPSVVRTLACDALATIGLWLQTLAGAGTFPPELNEPIALPSYVTSGWQRWD
eukprot:Nitzschia sp. Nitz4//scaffold47_size129522//49168//54612//NITZ4_003549-RA/size129522-snap-gene-0.196-mRNA-1//-1//CDS//3329552794//2421//frame0